jgi:hypothetical protein
VIVFGSVFIKKNNQIKYFFKKTETEPKPVQTDQFRFGSVFLGQKPVWIGFSVWLGFFGLTRFWLNFFLFFSGLGSVQFFQLQTYKTKTEPNRSVFSKF